MAINSSPFPYYVGVRSLHDFANKHSRVCVMNILGNESSKVTPISHAYSGGNVVAGVQYGTKGEILETPIGDINVFGSVKEVIAANIQFDIGVIYLPPAAVSSAVSELCAENDALEKVVIVTEKLSNRDSRYIRWGCQQRKVDVFGANSLGIANTWDQVRVGGALGGDNPGESLKPGSVAIYSNSGNFSTTLAQYLKTAGFGTSTILSSGKDLYIHFALPEFLYCAENDPRTKAIVLYIEPGGYYEKQALDWIKEGRINLTKPLLAVITGRWKKSLRRAVGHAGAIAGSGDDALAKERWFDNYFGLGVFNPSKPAVSERGIRVASIQDVPIALLEVMKLRGESCDFTPVGDLTLKPWFVNDQGNTLPPALSLPAVTAITPYAEEIAEANRHAGAQFIRESMRNRSGASRMNEKTQIAELHGKTILSLVSRPYASTIFFSVTKQLSEPNQLKIMAPLLNWFTHYGTRFIPTAYSAKQNGASPNAVIASAVLQCGDNPMFRALKQHCSMLIDIFYPEIGPKLDIKTELIKRKISENPAFISSPIEAQHNNLAHFFGDLLKRHGQESILTRFVELYNEQKQNESERANPLYLTLAAITLSIAWPSLAQKQITRNDAEELPIYLILNGILAGVSATNPNSNSFLKELSALKSFDILKTDYASTLFRLLFNRDHNERELFAFNSLLNLTVTNGPGTLSAIGAKESVSARNQLPTCFAGFLLNTGFAHGGNGFEAVKFLIDEFGNYDPYAESEEDWKLKIEEMAQKAATSYAQYKREQKLKGNLEYRKIPCTNHPVFKGKPVNTDPREEFVRDLLKKNGSINPFLEFYHHLVIKLHQIGATPNVFCVNIDAVLAAASLELMWKQFKQGVLSVNEMQDIVFTIFLYGRMSGTNAEISDHRNRGTDLDCRIPAKELSFAR